MSTTYNDIRKARLIPYNSIRLMNSSPDADIDLIIESLEASSTFALEPIETENDQGGTVTVGYTLSTTAYVIYNNWEDMLDDLEKFDKYGIDRFVLALGMNGGPDGVGHMIINTPESEVKTFNISWRIAGQQGPLPKIQFDVAAMLSRDAIEKRKLNELPFFRQGFGY